MPQSGGGPWEVAALSVIVEEAAGRSATWAGDWIIDNGGPVVYSNCRVHKDALRRPVRA